jgi:hypothetical protein
MERLAKEALQYQSRSAFAKGSGGAYKTASDNYKFLDEICSHMGPQQRATGYWDKEKCAAEALKYQKRSKFKKASGGAYSSALRNGWIDEICVHMLKGTSGK